MFDTKKTALFEGPKPAIKKGPFSKNAFIQGALKTGAQTLSGNGALKYAETEDPFLTEFGSAGNFKAPRSYEEVSQSMSTLWAIDPQRCVQFTLYLRLITRRINLMNGEKTEAVQRGQGLKHESILRMIWLEINQREAFQKNIHLFISCGSWKDVFFMLRHDLEYNGWDNRLLDWNFFKKIILLGLGNENTTNLVLKYIPSIKAKSKCTTPRAQANHMIGAWLADILFSGDKVANYKSYRQMKAKGTAHQWQQLISRGQHNLVNFDTVAGRALSKMVNGKYLENQGLTKKYEDWIDSQPVAKFTGYPHELFEKLPNRPHQIKTLNKQFDGLVKTAKDGTNTNTGMIVVRDTSGSMNSAAIGCNMSCFDIGKALALFFAQMLPDGVFADSFIEFANTATLRQWQGSTPYEKWNNDRCMAYGSTNFQSVIDLMVQMRRQGVDESEFPSGILCISDGEFNPAELGQTNVDSARSKLATSFSKEFAENFKIVLWNLGNQFYTRMSGNKFETFETDVPNVFYFSGYDASTIAFLTGRKAKEKADPKNAAEVLNEALSQEIMEMVS